MKKIQKTFSNALMLFLVFSLLLSCTSVPVTRAATAEEKAKQVEDSLNTMKQNRSSVDQELAKTTKQLNRTMKSIRSTQKELDRIKAKELGQYEALKKRIKYIYENTSSMNYLTLLIESESITDFLNRAEFVSSMSAYDRKMLNQIQELRKSIQEQEKKLLGQQKKLNSAKAALDKKYSALTSQIDNASGELAKYKAEIEAAKAAAKAYEELTGNTDASAEKEKQPDNSSANDKNEESGSSEKPSKPSLPPVTGDTTLFAAILECEAGSSDYDALLAVATVIMNRVESPKYPNTLSGVIYQSGQFSPTWTGKLDKVLNRGPKSLCMTVAKDALNGARLDAVRDCYSFRASYTGRDGIIVGDNVFF